MGKTIRVGSWNIWVYGKRDYKGIARLIKRNKMEIVGLQEAAIYYGGKARLDMARKIAKELGYHYVFMRSIDARPKDPFIQGNAIVSKFPISGAKCYALNAAPTVGRNSYETERRILVSAKIRAGSRVINFLTTHLEYSMKAMSTKTRFDQARKVSAISKKLKRNVILTGDFNSMPGSREIRLLGKALSRLGGNEPTWTVYPFNYEGWKDYRLRYRLDNIFVSRDVKVKGFKVLKSKISDHLPIMADVRLSES